MLLILLTGLSGAGKTTLANRLREALMSIDIAAEVFDGDIYRLSLSKDLGFSATDRRENIARIAKLADEKKRSGVIAIIAAIAPFEDLRVHLKQHLAAEIIWIRCDLSTLVKRDTKRLYYRASLPDTHPDKVWNLSGINDPYEIPEAPDLIIDTNVQSVEESTGVLLNYVLTQIKI